MCIVVGGVGVFVAVVVVVVLGVVVVSLNLPEEKDSVTNGYCYKLNCF